MNQLQPNDSDNVMMIINVMTIITNIPMLQTKKIWISVSSIKILLNQAKDVNVAAACKTKKIYLFAASYNINM